MQLLQCGWELVWKNILSFILFYSGPARVTRFSSIFYCYCFWTLEPWSFHSKLPMSQPKALFSIFTFMTSIFSLNSLRFEPIQRLERQYLLAMTSVKCTAIELIMDLCPAFRTDPLVTVDRLVTCGDDVVGGRCKEVAFWECNARNLGTRPGSLLSFSIRWECEAWNNVPPIKQRRGLLLLERPLCCSPHDTWCCISALLLTKIKNTRQTDVLFTKEKWTAVFRKWKMISSFTSIELKTPYIESTFQT